MRKVLWTKPQKFPSVGVHRSQRKFLTKEFVFTLQTEIVFVGISKRFLQESCLSEKDGFHLHQIVTVFAHSNRRDAGCPPFKGITVLAETESTGNGDKGRVLPIPLKAGMTFHDLLSTHFQTFHLQGRQPAMNQPSGKISKNIFARRLFVCKKQMVVVIGDITRHRQHKLWHSLTIVIGKLFVFDAHNMQNDILISRVAVVPMTMPIAGTDMYLHIANPNDAVNLHFGVQKIRTSICVVQTRIQDFQGASIGRFQFTKRKNLVFPAIMQQLFHAFLRGISSAKIRKIVNGKW